MGRVRVRRWQRALCVAAAVLVGATFLSSGLVGVTSRPEPAVVHTLSLVATLTTTAEVIAAWEG